MCQQHLKRREALGLILPKMTLIFTRKAMLLPKSLVYWMLLAIRISGSLPEC